MKCRPDCAGIQLAFMIVFAFASTIGRVCGGGTGWDGGDTLLEGSFVVGRTCWSMEEDERQGDRRGGDSPGRETRFSDSLKGTTCSVVPLSRECGNRLKIEEKSTYIYIYDKASACTVLTPNEP